MSAATRALLAVVAFFVLPGAAAALAEIPIPQVPAQWATDTAGFLKPETIAQLNARLHAYETKTGHQILVYIAPTTGATPLEDWTVRAFHAWRVGRKGLNDGLILFIFPNDHTLRIEVGYGLESTMPDVTAKHIIDDTIAPQLKAGHPDRGVTAGVDRILGVVGGETPGQAGSSVTESSAQASDYGSWRGTLLEIVLILVFLLPFAFFFILRARLARGGTHWIAGTSGASGSSGSSSSFSDDSGSSDDDFSSGGGDSGGGGASGSW